MKCKLVAFPEGMVEQMDVIKTQEGLSYSAQIRTALSNYLKEYKKQKQG
ncbi:MAG: hypothetical protein ABIJ18_02825 [archaeon]